MFQPLAQVLIHYFQQDQSDITRITDIGCMSQYITTTGQHVPTNGSCMINSNLELEGTVNFGFEMDEKTSDIDTSSASSADMTI